MGAVFQTMTVDGSKTRNEVESAFRVEQDQDRYENGHSYSGGLGMATGLRFVDRTFNTQSEAEDYLSDTAVKWSEALCVLYNDENGAPHWIIGAWCAS